jgi:hypothetical protein
MTNINTQETDYLVYHYLSRQVAPFFQDKSPTNLKRSSSHKISSSSTVYLNTKINIFNSYLIPFTHRKRTIIHECAE